MKQSRTHFTVEGRILNVKSSVLLRYRRKKAQARGSQDLKRCKKTDFIFEESQTRQSAAWRESEEKSRYVLQSHRLLRTLTKTKDETFYQQREKPRRTTTLRKKLAKKKPRT